MRTFVLILFWLYVVITIVRFVHLIGEHPRQEKPVSVGLDSAGFILCLALTSWAAYLLWGST